MAVQRGVEVEHVIIDGASTDQTVELIRQNQGANVRLVSEPDQGIYDAMNKGITLAIGDVVGTLNADDFYAADDVLAEVHQVMENPQIDACYADLDYVDAQNSNRIVRAWRSRSFRPGLFRAGWMPAHPTFFVRKQVYAQWGTFDPAFKLAADFELTMRFFEVGKIRARYVPHVWVKMRMGGATNRSLRNVLVGNWESYRACQKNGLRVTPFFMIRKVLSRLPQFLNRGKC